MPVLVVSQNGAITHRVSIDDLVANHAQDAIDKVVIVTTDQTITASRTIVCSDFVVANNAVITVNLPHTLTITANFTKPSWACFAGTGTVVMPTAGPGATQDFSVKGLTAAANVSAVNVLASGVVSGTILPTAGNSIAAAATTDLTNQNNFLTITGAATINSFGTGVVGQQRTVRFNSAGSVLTHSANLLCPGDQSITVTAGDFLDAVCQGSGQWFITNYHRGASVSTAANGWYKTTDGIIFQWGYDTATGAGISHNFPIAFPTACLSIAVAGGNTTAAWTNASISSASAFVLYAFDAAGLSASVTSHWIAIGH